MLAGFQRHSLATRSRFFFGRFYGRGVVWQGAARTREWCSPLIQFYFGWVPLRRVSRAAPAVPQIAKSFALFIPWSLA
jgi:hypothetical protein